MPTPLDPKRIRIDLDTQSRVALNEETVKEYAEAMATGTVFPPLRVFYDESKDEYILADGFHRLAAHLLVRPDEPILVEVTPGSVEDAQWESIGANKSHGLRRTNGDKRNAVTMALLHPKSAEETNRGIANHVGVAEGTVRNIRQELVASAQITQITSRIVRRGDQVYQQNTENIGSGQAIPPHGSTCAICCHFAKGHCESRQFDPVPWTEACVRFVKREIEDGGNDKTVRRRGPSAHQHRRLKDCITIHLPDNNPQLFAIELRNGFPEEYLRDCMETLLHILDDKDD